MYGIEPIRKHPEQPKPDHMKNLLCLLGLLITVAGHSQDLKPVLSADSEKRGKTLLKYNIPGAFFKSHTIQLERVVGPKHSIAVSVGFGAKTSLPF